MFLYKLYVSQYYKYVSPSERCPTQPESPQVFQAGGEREGRRLDGGRHRVPQEEESQGKQPVDQVSREYQCSPLSLVEVRRGSTLIGQELP